MSSRRAARRRFRVVARPRARARRARMAAAAAAVVLLGGVAVIAARQTLASLRARVAASARPGGTVVDAPAPLRALAQALVDATPGAAADKAAALRARLPCAADVTVRRGWGDGPTTLSVVLRRAVAPALRGGRPSAALGDDGTVFAVPDGVYALSGPEVDPAGADAQSLRDLAREWPTLAAPGALPAPLAGASFSPDGWRLRLADGTVVLWGRLDWTREKLARLKEALSDARSREPGTFAADLRFFEDGKVLLKPLASGVGTAAFAVRGGLR
ncbi:MAG: cell division protein FtsQ [Elusimicrobia bacterium]|nr:cell division protein FtsQ [Elusimicrobiota bacterium]